MSQSARLASAPSPVPSHSRVLARTSDCSRGVPSVRRPWCPFLQEGHAARVGQAKEEVLGRAQHRPRLGQRGVGLDQLGRAVDGAADFTGIAVLVLGVAARAFALDVAVGQEHALDRIVELLDLAGVDETGGFQRTVDVLGQFDVFRRVGAVPVVEVDVEAVQVFRPLGGVAAHQRLGGDAFGLGLEHDGRAVGVVRPHEMHGVARHAHGAHPGVGLDVLHDVADVEGAVGVGQGGGDEDRARHGAGRGEKAKD